MICQSDQKTYLQLFVSRLVLEKAMAKAEHKSSDVLKKPSTSLSSYPNGIRLPADGHLKVLRRCLPILLKDLDPADIVDRLTIDDRLRTDLRDCVLAPKTREERVMSLLSRLEKSNEDNFLAFVDALRDRYRHLHSLLEQMMRTCDSEDDDDKFRERKTIPGDVLRKFLRDSTTRSPLRRHIQSAEGKVSHRAGSESCSDPSVESLREDAGEEGAQYLPCYVVSSRGKIQKWVRHANVLKKLDNDLVEPSSAKVYMAVVMKDLVFRRTDRSSLPDLVKQPPDHCHQIYVIDEDSKYSLTSFGDDKKSLVVDGGASLLANKGQESRSKNRVVVTDPGQRKFIATSPVSENAACSEISDPPMPPALPPKPKNLPPLSLFPGGRRRPCGATSSFSSDETTPRSHLSSVCRFKEVVTRQSHEPLMPPIPSRFTAQETEERRTQLFLECSTKRVEGRTSVGHAEIGRNAKTEECKQRQMNGVEEQEEEEEDGREISLSFNFQLDDTENDVTREKEYSYEAVELHSDGKERHGKGVVEKLPVEVDTDIDADTLKEIVNYRTLTDRTDTTIHRCSTIKTADGGDSSQMMTTTTTAADDDDDESPLPAAKPNATKDSGVDSVVSQGFPDSPFATDAAPRLDAQVLPGTCNLGDIKIPLATDQYSDNSSTDYSYYEEIDLLSGGRGCSPSIYLDPCASVDPSYAFRPTCGAGYERTFEHLRTSPDQKVLPAGIILIADKDDACLFSEIFPRNRSSDLAEYVDPMANFEGTALGYDKDGLAYYLPTAALKEYGTPQEEDWFYPIEITSREATIFLTREKQRGCFVVYRPRTRCPGQLYTLSVCRGDDGDVLHYRIVENVRGDIKVEGHDRSFMTICDLVSYFRRNQSHLATRLRRSLRHARIPITPGYQYPEALEIPRSEIQVNGTIIGQGRVGMLCQRGQLHGTPVAVRVLQTDASVTDEDDFLEEVQVLTMLRQENIVRLIGVSCSSKPFYIVSEFFDRGTLAECLQNDTIRSDCIEDLFDVCMQIVMALSHLESHHYVLHRALAASNFFLTNDMLLKLANFDRARFVYDDNYLACPAEEVAVRWAAPEVLFQSLYSTKSDVWATGIVFWEVFSGGARPYTTLTDEETAVFVTEGGRLEGPSSSSSAYNLFSLMKSCWKPLPSDRPSMAAIYQKLKGDSNVYYYTTRPSPNSVSTRWYRSSRASSDIPQLPMKVKCSSSSSTSGISPATPPIHSRVKHPSPFVSETHSSEGVRGAISENGVVRGEGSRDEGGSPPYHLKLRPAAAAAAAAAASAGDTSSSCSHHRLSATVRNDASSSVGVGRRRTNRKQQQQQQQQQQSSSHHSSSVVSAASVVSYELLEKDDVVSRGKIIRNSFRKLMKGRKTAK